MTATVIPFPRSRETLGTADHELAKLAAMIHAKAIKRGKNSTFEQSLRICERVAAEVFAREFKQP